ncbi:hypothetical protein ACQ4PT_003746 [Festuca glaucescens]
MADTAGGAETVAALVPEKMAVSWGMVWKMHYGWIAANCCCCCISSGTRTALTDLLKKRLLEKGRKPYVIPGGGSNSLGNWGYIEAVREIEQQIQLSGDVQFDDIVVACGRSMDSQFAMALNTSTTMFKFILMDFNLAKGLGYAMNTPEDLKFVKDIAAATGIVLDPVYSGKAAYGMLKDMSNNPTKWEGRKVLFVHTGGLLGLYDKVDQLSSLAGSWSRMDLEELFHPKMAPVRCSD